MKLIPRDTLWDLDSVFDKLLTSSPTLSEAREGFFSPRVDIRETEGGYEISAEMPGVRKEDLNVTLENGVLSIEAEMQQEDKEEKDSRIVRQERRYGKFTRSFNLGEGVGEADIDASFQDGVLTLKVPKTEPKQPVSHRIEIH
ncbi:Hsp20/alpha crystallin family protein [Microbulbifer aggregans]|uniref:Hsp20/alpha crystallin family protein n=1 Tax=Microbulbifer aggregans TaxID=1769779 RepID=UPI001CFD30CB|nr:Hsp20/alpha crystallin family protein [Microbulbifer aggregans]